MKKPLVAIRANGGGRIGLGHIRRCLTLATALQDQGADVSFFVNREPGRPDLFVSQHGFEVIAVEQDEARDLEQTQVGLDTIGAQALIIDSYDVCQQTLERLALPVALLVDHLPQSPLPTDLLINGTPNAPEMGCAALPRTKLLLGASYLLLRKEFGAVPQHVIRRTIERVLVTTGGSDSFNLSPGLIRVVQETFEPVAIDVVVGPYFPSQTVAQLNQCETDSENIVLHRDPSNIRELMLNCDIALTGGGQTTYELAATGTPTIAIRLARNQTDNLQGLAERDTLVWVSDVEDESRDEKVRQALLTVAQDVPLREKMSRMGREIVDGHGASRVAREILLLCV